ncbi:hypothetical protein EVAR_64051_1 [Eumeta japonica]|uniref:HTH CENPB-type domain-containing protein n=1 Tax=Eumeta variegata TaxID=151549 RepID=A0A4C1ZVY6_EUMVA|nr:hypothetical protein EVAR_64051_1 [Eumeta japonica]
MFRYIFIGSLNGSGVVPPSALHASLHRQHLFNEVVLGCLNALHLVDVTAAIPEDVPVGTKPRPCMMRPRTIDELVDLAVSPKAARVQNVKKMAPTQSKHLRKDWDEEQMVKAIKMVREKKMGTLKAAKTFNVPRTTLQRLTYKTDLTPEEAAATKLGRKTVLGTQLENVLVEYVLTMESKFYGLTRSDLRRMAYMLAKRNNLPNPFQESGLAGKTWLRLFLKRHKDKLSVRKPTGTSFARAFGFNKDNVNNFFQLLDEIYEKNKYPPKKIRKTSNRGRKAAVASVITSSPYKNALMEKNNKKTANEQKTNKNKTGKAQKKKPKNKKKKNQKGSDDKDIEGEDEENVPLDSDTDPDPIFGDVPNSADAECMFYQQLFREYKGELWVRCLMCELWAHNDCAGPEFDTWIFDFCK